VGFKSNFETILDAGDYHWPNFLVSKAIEETKSLDSARNM
jgi:hypothetical protein